MDEPVAGGKSEGTNVLTTLYPNLCLLDCACKLVLLLLCLSFLHNNAPYGLVKDILEIVLSQC